MALKKSDALDGIRGLAVLMVFLSHTSGRDQYLFKNLNFHGIGLIGVYLFFTLSAFLISLSMFQKTINVKMLSGYFIKRVLRITPLYFFVILNIFYFQQVTDFINTKSIYIHNGYMGLIEHLFFYRGDGIFWSIVTEVQFYFLLPFLIIFLLNKKRNGLLILKTLAIVNFIIYFSSHVWNLNLISFVSPNPQKIGTFIDVFITGIIAAYLFTHHKKKLLQKTSLFYKYSQKTFVVLLALTFLLVSNNFLGLNYLLYKFRYLSILYGCVFSSFILFAYMDIDSKSTVGRLFRFYLLRFIGKIGYSFYLLHLPIIYLVNQCSLPSYFKFILSLVLTTFLSTVSYFLFEKPFIKLSHTLIKRSFISKLR